MVDLGVPPEAIKGHEQAKLRPCVVIKSYEKIELLIIVPLTSKRPRIPFYTIVELKKDSGGIRKDSFVLCHQIRSIAVERIKGKIGNLSDRDFKRIKSVLLDVLNL